MSTTNYTSITNKVRNIALKKLSSALTTKLTTYLSWNQSGTSTLLLAAAAGATAWRLYSFGDVRDAKTVQQLLNKPTSGLAVDYVEEGGMVRKGAPTPPEITSVIRNPMAITIGDVECPTETPIVMEDCTDSPSAVIPLFVEMDNTPIKVSLHRKVKKDAGLKYMNACIAECKVKFGVPSNTEANKKAVERFASNVMKSHGVRPTHIRQYLPMVVKMVFVPDQWQIEAERLSGTRSAWEAVMSYLVSSHSSVTPRVAAA